MPDAHTTSKRPTRSSTNPPQPSSSVSLDDLLRSLPCRHPQALDILGHIGPRNSLMLPLLLYGSHSTGKTRTILRILHHLRRPFAYVSCRSCYTPRLIFESILHQLSHEMSSNASSSAKRCEGSSEFVHLLRNTMRDRAGEDGLIETVYVVFDNLQLVSKWVRNSDLITVLFRLHDISRMPELGLIYVSSDAPDVFYSHLGSMEPTGVFFPDYAEDEMYEILMRNQPNADLYSAFLKAVLKPFVRVTRRLDEISNALNPLFYKYCEPLSALNVVPDEAMKRRLYDILQPHLMKALDQTFIMISGSSVVEKERPVPRKRSLSKSGQGENLEGLDFHMSLSAKYLLISAFLASRNPATLDAAMFDSTGGSGNQKCKRKNSELSIQKKESKELEILMKGPGIFSLERLLVIFQCITSVTNMTLEEEALEDGKPQQGGEIDLMSDVHLQFSTLCNAKFIHRGGGCPLDGSNRCRSNVDEEMALQVARSISFPLSKYIYRR